MTTPIEHLRNQRRGFKANLTRLEHFLHNLTGTEDKCLLKVKLDSLNKSYDSYQNIQCQIEALTPDKDRSDDEDVINNAVTDRFEIAIATFYEILESTTPVVQRTGNTTNVSLPKIQIKPFSGSTEEWESFITLFNSLIVSNERLHSDTEKFWYLKSLLRGEALSLIESLQGSDQNFILALDILKKAYDNKIKLLHSLFKALVELKPVVKSNQSLKDFYINSKKTFDLISNTGLSDTEKYESLIIFLLEQKLDFNSRRQFETERDSDEIPTAEYFFDFLQKRQNVLSNLDLFDKPSGKHNDVRKSPVSLLANVQSDNRLPIPPLVSPTLSTRNGSQKPNCIFCSDSRHSVYGCSKFLAKTPVERFHFAKAQQVCINCLVGGHNSTECRSTKSCQTCGKGHHTFLHFEKHSNTPTSYQKNDRSDPSHSRGNNRISNNNNSRFTTNRSKPSANTYNQAINAQNNKAQPSTSSFVNTRRSPSPGKEKQTQPNAVFTTFSAVCIPEKIILLPTALVNIRCSNGQFITGRALLDSASQISVINRSFVNKLHLPTKSQTLTISGIGNSVCTSSGEIVELSFCSLIKPFNNYTITCSVIDKITNDLPQFTISPAKFSMPNNVRLQLADPTFFKSGSIDLLIGADLYFQLLRPNVINTGFNMPSFVETSLGFVIAGPIAHYSNSINVNKNVCKSFLSIREAPAERDSVLDALVEKFWNQEEVPTKIITTRSDQIVENFFQNTTKILPSGKYQVDIPILSDNDKQLGQSFCMARQRFVSLEKKFSANRNLFEDYKTGIYDYLNLNHARVIPLEFFNASCNAFNYFVPHRAVIREESSSTKTRIVFDFSAKTDNGVSVNDMSDKGFQVQDNLFDILLRFRFFKFVLCADIKMMYRFIEINPNQRYLQNFLWRDDPSVPFSCIQLSCLSFGLNAAPFLATRVLKDIADHNVDLPLAQNAIFSQTYMDDILSGTHSEASLVQLHSELLKMLNKHGFQLHKWQSNCAKFLKSISTSTNEDFTNNDVDFNLNLDNVSSKILGLKWQPNLDSLKICTATETDFSIITKRKILSIISSAFDPMGLVNPLIVLGKLLMQSLWKEKISWDEPIYNSKILQAWKKFMSLLSELSEFSVPRFLFDSKSIAAVSLHGFCDASQMAYGACVYIVATYSDNSMSSRLLTSKSRVSPLKSALTIPKLELCAMDLLSKLTVKVLEILTSSIEFKSVNLWSDSLVALCWVKQKSANFNPFVARRVALIQENSTNVSWRHVRTHLNPADLLSRGKFTPEVHEFWLHGPEFLVKETNYDIVDTYHPVEELPECKKVILNATCNTPSRWEPLFIKHSNFLALKKVVAYILRFSKKLKRIPSNHEFDPSLEELADSQNFIIKIIFNQKL